MVKKKKSTVAQTATPSVAVSTLPAGPVAEIQKSSKGKFSPHIPNSPLTSPY